jgi:hypothetical protein
MTQSKNIQVQLWHGDCLQRLKEIESGSVDAVCSDPPYELGFMGKGWDSTGIAFDPNLYAELRRILKPGGVIRVFSATRTYHRVVQAMRNAGFEEVRLRAWTYGCLDETSEILTETGWKKGVEVQVGERVVCWDPDTEALDLMPIEGKTVAPFDGDMVRFVNDNTDQMLTPNHRVYKKHRIREMQNGKRVTSFESDWNVMEAAEINRWNTINLPLAGYFDGPGIDRTPHYAELLAWVWTEGGFDRNGNGVRITQSTRIAGDGVDHVNMIDTLVSQLVPGHKHYTRERTYRGLPYVEHTWFFTGEMAERIRRDLPGKHPTWDLLWRMSLEEKEVFLWTALCGDGSEGNREFYQKDPADREWYQALAHTMGWQGRINDKRHYVSLHENPQTQLQIRHLKHDREPYRGDVWCVKVPTGAFLARRNGRIFITGNSGFPKSLDISKQLDRHPHGPRPPEVAAIKEFLKRGIRSSPKTRKQIDEECGFSACDFARTEGSSPFVNVLPGPEKWETMKVVIGLDGTADPMMDKVRETAEREVVGQGRSGTTAFWSEGKMGDYYVTIPATDVAKQWEGYGTALKPAWEPIVCGINP